jgi:hypothetical protein
MEFLSRGETLINGELVKSSRKVRDYIIMAHEKKIERKKIDKDIETVLTRVRLMHELKKVSPDDVYTHYDPIYGEEFVEDTSGMDDSPNLTPELKRLL